MGSIIKKTRGRLSRATVPLRRHNGPGQRGQATVTALSPASFRSQPSLLPLSAQPPSALSPASFPSQHLLVMGKQRPQQGPLPQHVAVALATTGPDAPSSCSTPSPPLSPSSLEHHSSGPLFSIPNHRRCCHRWFR
jgi:hypothetical protein